MCNFNYRIITFTLYKYYLKQEVDMAKVRGSDISGLLGNLIFLKLNGKGVVRMAPRERSKNSWSEGQKMYRKKVSNLGAFWMHSIPRDIRKIFDLASDQMTAYNLFLKTNVNAFSADGTQIDFEWFHLSAGKLPLPHKLRANRVTSDPGKIEVSWQDDSDIGLAGTRDELKMVIVHDGKFTAPIATGALRKQETAVIQLPAGLGTIQGIYLSFASKERELYSADQWFEV
jgi:hypothetical protein